MTARKNRTAKSATIARDAQATINDLLADASREDRKAQPPCDDRFPSFEELDELAVHQVEEVPRWKRLRIEFCHHYNVPMESISVKLNGKNVKRFKEWVAKVDRLEAEAMSA